jgi:hypothetical protein
MFDGAAAASLRFTTCNAAALDSRAGLGERHRGWLLNEIVEDDRDPKGDNAATKHAAMNTRIVFLLFSQPSGQVT